MRWGGSWVFPWVLIFHLFCVKIGRPILIFHETFLVRGHLILILKKQKNHLLQSQCPHLSCPEQTRGRSCPRSSSCRRWGGRAGIRRGRRSPSRGSRGGSSVILRQGTGGSSPSDGERCCWGCPPLPPCPQDSYQYQNENIDIDDDNDTNNDYDNNDTDIDKVMIVLLIITRAVVALLFDLVCLDLSRSKRFLGKIFFGFSLKCTLSAYLISSPKIAFTKCTFIAYCTLSSKHTFRAKWTLC